MTNSAKGVVIYDAEYQKAAQTIGAYCNELSEIIERYCKCMKTITETAIMDQRIASRLVKLSEKMAALNQPLNDVAKTVYNECGKYITDVDAADQFLY